MKRLICVLLALVMVLGMVPMAGAAEEGGDTLPTGLYYRDLERTEDGSIYEDKENYNLEKVWPGAAAGISRTVKFYFLDEKGVEHELSLNDLSFTPNLSGALTRRPVDSSTTGEVIEFGAEAPGSGSVSYTLEGNTYVLDVNVALPDVGFYTQPVASAENYIKEFTLTNDSDSFYLVPKDSSCVINADTLTLSDDLQRIATYEAVENSNAIKFTISGSISGSNYYAEYRYGQNNWNGFSRIEITDDRPLPTGLYYRNMEWDRENEMWCEDENSPLYSSWETVRGSNGIVRFYFSDEGVLFPLSIDDLRYSDVVSLRNHESFILMDTAGFGSGNITYTDDENNRYSISVTVNIPDIAFYSSPEASAESYISEFQVTNDNATFYIVASNGCTIDSVNLQDAFGSFATTSISKDRNFCTVEITDPSLINENWNNFADVNYSREQGGNGNSFLVISILNRTGIVGNFYTQAEMNDEYKLEEWHGAIEIDIGTIQPDTLWFMAENGLSSYEAESIIDTAYAHTVTRFSNSPIYSVLPDKDPVITMVERGSTGVYDLKIELKDPDTLGMLHGYEITFPQLRNTVLCIYAEPRNKQLQFTESGINYAANFVFADDKNGYFLFENTNSFGKDFEVGPSPDNPWLPLRYLVPGVASVVTDSNDVNVYTKVENPEIKINKVWIETLVGSKDAIRFVDKNGNRVESMENVTAPVELTVHEGYTAAVLIWANFTVSLPGGGTYTGDVHIPCKTSGVQIMEFDYDRDVNTIQELHNATITEYLRYIADNYIDSLPTPYTVFNVTLGEGEFDETVVIDSRFSEFDMLNLFGSFFGTTLSGIDLNDRWDGSINGIKFVAGENNNGASTTAIFNGRLSIHECTFYNYDVAVETVGPVLPQITNSVFINNDIAWSINISGPMWRPNNDYNSFINNGTAIKVMCAHSANSAYSFRIAESNFINNGIDFDADTGSTVYMYRNYFGELKGKGNTILPGKYAEDKHNSPEELNLEEMEACKNAQISQYLQRRPAVIEVDGEGTEVVANPRWKYPIKDWWKINNKLEYDKVKTLSITEDDEEYEDILVVDWENGTTIITEEADDLVIGAESFAEEGDKAIDVVDKDENALGSWIFD